MKTIYKLKSVSLGVLLGLYGTGAAYANPTGANVVHGSVSFHAPNAQTLQITNSPNAIINWQDFSIDAGETTQFIQQGANSAVLNRVVGDNLSQIHGSLLSNGRVFLINQAGIVFGESASIDTAGLVASTLNITDQDFLDGNFHFESESAGSVINRGVIAAGPGGEVVFIAPQIENSGSITVEDGALILAAGESVTLSSWDLEGVEFEVQAPDNSVLNLGELVAEQGAVGLFAGSIRNEGVIEANSLSVDAEGNIVLSAQQNIELTETSAISASGDNAGEIVVISEQGDVYASGSLSASSEIGDGGSVHVLGERVALLDGAHVNASGATGGGEVLIGGDFQGGNSDIKNAQYTHVAETAVVNADALETGDGGKAIVWADKNTVMLGEATAKGGAHSGDGGLIEVSGKESLVMRGTVDATAANGERGNILFDPKNISVGGGGLGSLVGNVLFSDNPDQDVTFNVLALTTALLGGNVSLQANNDVTFTESFTSLGNGSNLNVDAGRSVTINAGVVISLVNGDFNVLANAPSTGGTPVSIPDRDPGAAEIRMLANSVVNTNGGAVNLVIGNGDGRTGAQATTGNITFNGGIIDTDGGNVSLSANTVELAANSHIRSADTGNAGNISIEVNDFNIDGTSTLDTSGFSAPGNVIITQNSFNQGQNISLGYVTAQAGTLGIEAAELDRINGHLIVGNTAHTGSITVGGQVSGANLGDITLRTGGDVLFAQNANGIDAGASNVLIDADKIVGSVTSVAPDVLGNEVTLVTENGIEQSGGGALSVSTSNLTFTNSTGGDVIVATQGGGTVVDASSNINGDIEISQLAPGDLTLDGVSIGSGNGYIAAHTSQTGSNVVVGSAGVQHNGVGHIELNAGGAGNSVTQSGGVISTANGNISLQGSDFSLTGSSINAGAGNIYIAPSQNSTALNLSQIGFDSFMLSGITAQNVILGTKHSANSGATITSASAINWGSAMGALNTSYNLFLETEPTGTITLESPITLGAGNNLTFTSNDVVLNAGGVITGTATSDLVFNHNGSSGGIGIDTTGGMSISAAELALMQGSFDHVAFSTQNAGNDINIGGAGISLAHATIFNSMGNVGIGASLDVTGAGQNLTVNAGGGSAIALGEGISTAGGDIQINGALSVQGDHSISSSGGSIVFNNTIDADMPSRNLTVNAGAGSVSYNGSIGQNTPALNSLVTSGSGGININAPVVTTTQNQVYNDIVTIASNASLNSTAGSVLMNSAVSGVGALDVNANVNASLGSVSGLNALNVTASTGSILAGDISTSGNQTYSGNLSLGGNLSTTGGAILINDNLELTGVGTQTITSNNGNVTFVGDVNGDSGMPGTNSLDIDAATGNVAFGTEVGPNSIGQTSALNNLTVSANDITLDQVGAAPTTAGVVGITSLNAANNITFTGGFVAANAQNYTAAGAYDIASSNSTFQFNALSGNLTFNGGNVQSTATPKQIEFISGGGDIDLSNTNIVNDGTSNNTGVIVNSAGGNVSIRGVGNSSSNALSRLFVDAGTGTVTIAGEVNTGDFANNLVAIKGDTLNLSGAAASINTDNVTEDGKILFLVDNFDASTAGNSTSGSADTIFDTATTARQIHFETGPGGVLSIENQDLNNFSSTGKYIFGISTTEAASLNALLGGGIVARNGAINFMGTLNQGTKDIVLGTTGSIAGQGTAATDIIANQLDIVGAAQVANNVVPLRTQVNALGGSTSGVTNIAEVDDLNLLDFLVTNNNPLTITAGGNIGMQTVTANNGSVSITSTGGNITDQGTVAANSNISGAGTISLISQTGIGQSGNAIEIDKSAGVPVIRNLTAEVQAGSGNHGLYLDSIAAAAGNTLRIQGLTNNSGGDTILRSLQAGENVQISGITQGSQGNFTIQSNADLLVDSDVNGLSGGNLNLQAVGTSGNVVVAANVVTSGGGTVLLESANGDVRLNSNTGSFIRANDGGTVDLRANNGAVNMTGSNHFIGNSVGAVDVVVTAANGINLSGNNDVDTLQASNTATGSITFVNNSALQTAGTGLVNSATGTTDDIVVTTAGDLQLTQNVSAATGSINLTANGNITQTTGQVSGNTLQLNASAGAISLNNTQVQTLDAQATGAVSVTEVDALNITRINSSGAGDVNINSTGGVLNVVAGNDVINSDGNISLTGSAGLSIADTVTANNGNVLLNAAGSNVTITGATVSAGNGVTVNAVDLAINATTSDAQLLAANAMNVNLAGNLNIAGSATSDAILESTGGDASVTAQLINLTAGSGGDALIKAANVASLSYSVACPSCNLISVTPGADAGVVASTLHDINMNLSNWSGLGDGVSWNDSGNWFGGIGLSGDINLDANSSASGPITVNDVIAANNLSGTKALNLVGGGSLTLASDFNYNSQVNVTGGNLVLNGSSNTLNELDLNGGTISGAGQLNVGNSFDWSGGGLAINTDVFGGSTTISGAAPKQLSADLNGFDITFNTTGDLDVVSGGILSVDSSSPGLTIQQGNIISSDGLGIVDQQGAIAKTGSGSASISALFNSSGGLNTVNVAGGTLAIGGTSIAMNVDDGNYTVANGATLRFTDDRSLTGQMTLNAGSTAAVTGGTVVLAGSAPSSTYDGRYRIENAGVLQVEQSFTFNADTIIQSGGTLRIGNGTLAHSPVFAGQILGAGDIDMTTSSTGNFNGGINITGQLNMQGNQNANLSGTNNVGSVVMASGSALNGVLSTINIGNLTSNGGQLLGTNNTVNVSGAANLDSTNISGANVLNLAGTSQWTGGQLGGLFANGGIINNSGTFNLNHAGALRTNQLNNLAGGIINVSAAGTYAPLGVVSNTGQLNVLAGTILDVSNGYTQTAGELSLGGGTVRSTALLQLSGGELTGDGLIDADLQLQNASLAPGNGAGVINVSGDLELGTGSMFAVELGGTGAAEYDQVVVAGDLTIDNTAQIDVSLINGYETEQGDEFAPLRFSNVSGAFSTAALPNNVVLEEEATQLSLISSVSPSASSDGADNADDSGEIDFDLEDELAELYEYGEELEDDIDEYGVDDDESEEDEEEFVTELGEGDGLQSGTLICI